MDLEEKSVNYSKLRATNLPTCTRLKVPPPGTVRQEAVMAGLKEKMMDEVRNYVRNGRGWSQPNVNGNDNMSVSSGRKLPKTPNGAMRCH